MPAKKNSILSCLSLIIVLEFFQIKKYGIKLSFSPKSLSRPLEYISVISMAKRGLFVSRRQLLLMRNALRFVDKCILKSMNIPSHLLFLRLNNQATMDGVSKLMHDRMQGRKSEINCIHKLCYFIVFGIRHFP